jgi:beta-N-acetylhexosaminidase
MYSSKFSSNVFYKNLNIQSDFQLSLKTKKFLSTIPLEQKIAQLLLVNIEGKNNFVPIRDFKEGGKNGILPGGYLLFSFNLSPTPESLNSFLTQVEQAHLRCSSFLPLFSVDCEGGKVNRLGIYQEQKLPSQEYISSHLNSSEAQKLYSESSELMNKCGLDLNFAPVVEVKNKFNEKFLSERSYGSFENTVKYSVIQISEAKKNNCLNVIKHFPGNSQDDPHAMVSVLDVSKTFFEQELLAPFNEVIKIKPHGVLISHVIIPSIDNEPACFSKKIVTEYLKEKLKFTGIVYSDDIYMKALTQDSSLENVALAASKAFKAGVNVIMSSEKKYLSLVYKIADYCTQDFDLLQNIEESVFKLTKEKYKLSKVFFN